MNRIDFGMEEYQANVLRTARRELSWNETIENCLYGLIGELAEIVESLNPQDNQFFSTFIEYGKLAETVKKHKYHGKLMKKGDYEENLYKALITLASQDSSFNPEATNDLTKELGDMLYYQTWLIDTLGHELSEVAQLNVEKLRKRYGEGFSIEKSLNRKD